MRTWIFIGVVSCMLLAAISAVQAQWVPIGPVGPVSTLAANGSSLFAGSITGGGVFVSTNGGAAWRAASAGLPSTAITALASTPSTVFAGVSGQGIWASTDAGASWADASAGLISSNVNVIAAVGSTLFAGPSTFGAFRSTDGGTMWLPSGHGFATGMAVAFIGVGSRVYGGSASAGVFISTDGGDNWTQSNTGLGSTAITSLAAIGTTVFAATSNKGVFVSTDNGATWGAVGPGIPHTMVIAMAGVTPSGGTACLVTATGSGVFGISKNNGATWDTVDPGLSHRSINALMTVGTTLYAATGDGVLSSTDGGYHWAAMSDGLLTSQVTGISPANGAIRVGTKSGGVLSSTNGGSTWARVNAGLGSMEITGLTRGWGYTFAGTGAGVFALPDNGSAWIAKNNGLSGGVNTVKVIGNVLYTAPGSMGARSSIDSGATWRFGAGSIWDLAGTIVQSFGPALSLVMAGTSGRGILWSATSGLNWTLLNAGLTNEDVYGFAGHNGRVYAATGAGPFVLADGAEIWAPAANGFEGNSATAIALFRGTLIAGTKSGGVFVSTDEGANWAKANTGLTVNSVSTVEVDSPYVYLGTDGGGVYRRTLTELFTSLAVEDQDAVPNGFALGQSYPNPFNPSAVIPFDIGTAGGAAATVTIRVYDVLGREVATILNDQRTPGRHAVSFNGAGLASGVYVYRMEVTSAGLGRTLFRDVRTMLLLR